MKVLLTVDWEVNCERWLAGEETRYWGVFGGTPYLESLLDEMGIPCTWFVESNSRYPERDLPVRHPDLIKPLFSRRQDEVGAHVHMGDFFPSEDRWTYPATPRLSELRSHLEHASSGLKTLGGTPRSFRSGAYYHPHGLPSSLLASRFQNDSSRYYDWWVRPPAPLRTAARRDGVARLIKQGYRRTVLRSPIPPYECNRRSIMRKGKSGIVEFPCSLHLMYLLEDRKIQARFWQRIRRNRTNVLTLYFHIFELTRMPDGSREPSADRDVYRGLKDVLDTLSSLDLIEFSTCDATAGDFRRQVT